MPKVTPHFRNVSRNTYRWMQQDVRANGIPVSMVKALNYLKMLYASI